MTNAEKIRNMSEEELAEFLDKVHNFPCTSCCNNLNWCTRNNAPEPVCKRHYLDWLAEKASQMQYEVFENNADGLYLCILEDSKCIRIFENFEYGECGILANALKELSKDPLAYESWDGDLVERLLGEGQEVSPQSLYEDGLGDLIADSQGFVSSVMGAAGRRAMGAKY